MWSLLKAPLVRLRVGRWVFAPRVLATLLVLALMPVFLGLGHWQLDRGSAKAERALLYAARGKAQPVDLRTLDALAVEGEDLRFRAARVTGRFQNEHSVVLDNRPHQGRPGYHVLTPFRVDGALVLIDRGWVPADPDRTQLPAIPAVAGTLTLSGQVAVPEPGFRLGASVLEGTGFPLRVQQLDFAELKPLLGANLREFVVQLDAREPNGFVRDWGVTGLNPDRHFAYAIQWFALGALLVVLYFVANLRREEKNK